MDDAQRKAMIRETFDTVSSGYDNRSLRFFVESAKLLPDFLKLKGNEHLLDVGTRTGNAALALAPCLPEGQITGIDFSGGMIAQAKAKAKAAGVSNIEFLEIDMQQLPFLPKQFDAAISAFSIFFVEEMEDQLRQICDTVTPGGRVAITAFEDNNFQPLVERFYSRLERYGVSKPLMTWKRIASVDRCRSFLNNAGLDEVVVVHRNLGYHLSSSDEWWDVIWNAGFRRLVNQLSPPDREQFKKEHLQDVEALRTDEGIWFNVEVLFGVATKPDTTRSKN